MGQNLYLEISKEQSLIYETRFLTKVLVSQLLQIVLEFKQNFFQYGYGQYFFQYSGFLISIIFCCRRGIHQSFFSNFSNFCCIKILRVLGDIRLKLDYLLFKHSRFADIYFLLIIFQVMRSSKYICLWFTFYSVSLGGFFGQEPE